MKTTRFRYLASKRSVAILTSIFLLSTSGQAALAADNNTYTDVPAQHWAANAIERLSGYELVNGFNGVYYPTKSITRGELAVIIDRTMKFHEKSNVQFSDLKQAFYTDAILRATYTGVMKGEGNEVRPLDNASRQEAVTMLARAFGISPAEGETTFTDRASIASWAKGYIKAMQDKSYVKGNNNKFNPTQEITRAEIAQLLDSLIGEIYSKEGIYNKKIDGNVIINSADVVLKDTVIEDNLIIAEGVAEGDVTLENVTVVGNTIIRGGGDHSIHVKGSSKLSTVTVEKLDSAVRLALSDQAKTGTIGINDGAEGVKVEIGKEASVDTIKTKVKKTIISNQGTVNKMEINADDVSVNTQNAVIAVGKDQTGVTINNKDVQGGSTVEGNNSSTASTSGNSNNTSTASPVPATPAANPVPAPTTTLAPIQIVSVETVTNGRVKLVLNRATETALTKDNISIICNSGGKDMTVLDVLTTDNMNYDIRTAYYDDNSYSLAIIQDNKVVSEKGFVSKYDAPALTSTEVIRKDAATAEFTYVSDISGELYYMISKNETAQTAMTNRSASIVGMLMSVGTAGVNVNSIWTQAEAPTAEQIMKNGTSTIMKNGMNTIQINQLEKDTSYKLYYVAKGIDNKVTSVKSISIAAKAATAPVQNNISIVNFEGFDTKATDLLAVQGGFNIELSKPTEKALTADAFLISCPGQSNITLGRLETKDNQHYTIYMKEGYMFADQNTYTVTITFPDKTVATSKSYVDLSAPLVTGVTINRTSADKATVTFNSNEEGFIYWKGLDKSQTSDTSFKDPKTIVKDVQKVAIREGGNVLELTGISAANVVFGFVTEDKLGNQPRTYDYYSVPDKISTLQQDKAEELIIQDVKVATESDDLSYGSALTLDVTMAQDVDYVSNEDITISGTGAQITGYRYLSVSQSSESQKTFQISVRQELNPGTYVLKITLGGKTGSKEFTIK